MQKVSIAALGAALVTLAAASDGADAATAGEIRTDADRALKQCYAEVAGCRTIGGKAKGVLVFPEVTKAGVGIGGSYGTGALMVGGKTVGYYSTTSASVGLQLGAQKYSQVIFFLTEQSLANFRASDGWTAGGDASVAVIDQGAADKIDTLTQDKPVVAFVYGEQGLMGSLSLEGAKISPYTPEG